jgi:hypothetical protein
MKNAGEFVRRFFADIGSAGGHRAMAKAVVPLGRFHTKFGMLENDGLVAWLQELVDVFLHEKEGKGQKADAKSEA